MATKTEQTTALALSSFAFTVCFAIWTIFSIIGVQIQKDMGLTDTQFSLLIGTPILTGSLVRLFFGIWADQYGGRPIFMAIMLSSAFFTWCLTYADTYEMLLLTALGVGISGGSFVVGVAYLSKWYDKEHQGTALGSMAWEILVQLLRSLLRLLSWLLTVGIRLPKCGLLHW
jgi:MFS transporter, NNP family, nitrate/nitrite transporter